MATTSGPSDMPGSGLESSEPIALAKGCEMRFFHTKPSPSQQHLEQWVETSYSGQPGSYLLSVPTHWHEFHDEYMKVLRGRMEFTLDGVKTIVSADDDELEIIRGVVHGFSVIEGVEVLFRERTRPGGGFKQEFFRDLFSNGQPSILHGMRAFSDGDTYIAMPGGFKSLDKTVTNTIGTIAKWVLPTRDAPQSVAAKDG